MAPRPSDPDAPRPRPLPERVARRRVVRRRGATLAAAAAALAVVGAAGLPARAAVEVTFADTRILRVERVEWREANVVLHLPRGGELHVAAALVTRVDDVPDLPPEPSLEDTPTPADPGTFGPPLPTWQERAGAHAAVFARVAEQQGVDPALLTAVALAESRLDPFALSPKGAQGLMQLMPGTARILKVENVWDLEQNLDGGARWLKRLLDAYSGQIDLALAAYNAGEEAVRRFGGIPPYRETEGYVKKIGEWRRLFARAARQPAPVRTASATGTAVGPASHTAAD